MMVRDLAFLLGGHLVIETRQGPGITIKVMVPMQKVRDRQAAPLRAARVMVADDRSLLQTGVIKLLADDDRVEVVGQTSDEEHLLELAESLRPDVVLLNLQGSSTRVADVVLQYPEPEVLLSGIVSVLGGLCLFPRSIEPLALARAPRQRGTAQHLTQRELQVIRLAATGLSNKEIARQLGASYKTIRNQMSSIYTKLQIHDRSQAVLYAIRAGLV
jgi:DNA-binding NarL/FixJ family response regulator